MSDFLSTGTLPEHYRDLALTVRDFANQVLAPAVPHLLQLRRERAGVERRAGVEGGGGPLPRQVVAGQPGSAERLDQDNIDYASLAPEHIADAIIHAIDQPWGVSIAEVTVRAAGDYFIL